MKAEFPSSIDSRVRFLDRYSVWDLLITGVLVLVGEVIASPVGTVFGAVLGLAIAELKSSEKRLDQVLTELLQSLTGPSEVRSPKVSRFVDGSAVLTNESVMGVVKVSSVETGHLSDRDKQANRDTVAEMVSGLEGSVEIHSRQRCVELSDQPGNQEHGVVTDHYVVIQNSAENLYEAHKQVTSRCNAVRDALTAADLYAEHLEDDELKTAIGRLYLGDVEVSNREYSLGYGEKQVCRVLYIYDFPRQLPFGWVAEVLNLETSGLVDAVQVVDPISDRQRGWMDRVLARLETEISASQKPFRRSRLQQQKQDLEDLIEVDASGETVVNYGVCFVIRGETGSEAEEMLETVQSILRQYRLETEIPRFQRVDPIKQVSGLHINQVNRTRPVPGFSAASGFSFAAHQTIEPDGIRVGLDQRNSMPVVVNRFSWEAGHTTVTGKTGSGKSYWTGLTLVRSAQIYDDLEIYIIDPKKRDYGGLTEALGGETVLLNTESVETGRGNTVRFTVEDPSKDNTKQLEKAVRHVYRESSKSDSKSLVVIDELHQIITKGNQVYEEGLQAVSDLIRGSRDRNTSVTLVTQNVDDLARSNEGRNILRNTDCNLFFKQKDLDTEAVEFFHFTEKEATKLCKLRTGTKTGFSEALIRGPVNTCLKVAPARSEHQLIKNGKLDSTPEETSSTQQKPVKKPDGGNKETSPENTVGKQYGLLQVVSQVLLSPLGLFEAALVIGFPVGAFLTSIGWLQTVVPEAFPSQFATIDFVAGWTAAVILVELFWVFSLGVDLWMAQPWGQKQ